MENRFFAYVELNGPALGVGESKNQARQAAADLLGEPVADAGGYQCVEITEAQYLAVKNGDQDAWSTDTDRLRVTKAEFGAVSWKAQA